MDGSDSYGHKQVNGRQHKELQIIMTGPAAAHRDRIR